MNTYQVNGLAFQGVIGSNTYYSHFSSESADFESPEKTQYRVVKQHHRLFENNIGVRQFKLEGGVYALNFVHEAELALQQKPLIVVSVPEMISTIKDVFGINLSQLARIVKVSRPTVYAHLKGDGSTECYNRLYDLACEVIKYYPNIESVLKSVNVEGKTLLSHLQSGKSDQSMMMKYVHEAMKKQPAEKRRKEISHIEQVKRNLASHR